MIPQQPYITAPEFVVVTIVPSRSYFYRLAGNRVDRCPVHLIVETGTIDFDRHCLERTLIKLRRLIVGGSNNIEIKPPVAMMDVPETHTRICRRAKSKSRRDNSFVLKDPLADVAIP